MDRLLTLDILPSVDGEEKIDTEKVNIFLKELLLRAVNQSIAVFRSMEVGLVQVFMVEQV